MVMSRALDRTVERVRHRGCGSPVQRWHNGTLMMKMHVSQVGELLRGMVVLCDLQGGNGEAVRRGSTVSSGKPRRCSARRLIGIVGGGLMCRGAAPGSVGLLELHRGSGRR
jgi:hypothetical protein